LAKKKPADKHKVLRDYLRFHALPRPRWLNDDRKNGSALDTVGFMVRTLEGRAVKGKSELRLQFESPKGYKQLAARLKPGY
jgi:hypothetical protein